MVEKKDKETILHLLHAYVELCVFIPALFQSFYWSIPTRNEIIQKHFINTVHGQIQENAMGVLILLINNKLQLLKFDKDYFNELNCE